MKIVVEDYLDKEEKFWDYKTADVQGNNIFDTTKTGMSYYDDFIHDSEYMRDRKNLESKIVQLSPDEYFQGCADIFGSTKEQQINQTARDVNTIEKLKYVIQHFKKRFPVTFLNYAAKQQEGRHRMYVAGELFGWETKHPVMVIDWADKEKAEEDRKKEQKKELDDKVRMGVKDALMYKYTSFESFEDQLQWSLNRSFGHMFSDDGDIDFNIEVKEDEIKVSSNGGEYSFRKDEIKIEEPEKEVGLEDDEDIDAWLADYLDDFEDRTEEEKEKLRNKIRNA